jgi:hypothetical protein
MDLLFVDNVVHVSKLSFDSWRNLTDRPRSRWEDDARNGKTTEEKLEEINASIENVN